MTSKNNGEEKSTISLLRLLYFRPLIIAGFLLATGGMIVSLAFSGELIVGQSVNVIGGYVFIIGLIILALGYTEAQLKKREFDSKNKE